MRFDYQDDSDDFEGSRYETEKSKLKIKKHPKESEDYSKKPTKKPKR